MDIYNISSINLNNNPIKAINTTSLINDPTHIPSSKIVYEKFNELSDKIDSINIESNNDPKLLISEYQYVWDITKYFNSQNNNQNNSNIIDIPECFCEILLNYDTSYYNLSTSKISTSNYHNNELISSNMSEYTSENKINVIGVCAVKLKNNYPYKSVYIPSQIIINPEGSDKASFVKQYTPTVLLSDEFYNIEYIKAPTVKLFDNSTTGSHTSDNYTLNNAAIVKSDTVMKIYENINEELLDKADIIPDTSIYTYTNSDGTIINNVSTTNLIMIQTDSEEAKLIIFIKSGSKLITSTTSKEFINDEMYVPGEYSDSLLSHPNIHTDYFTLNAFSTLILNYGSVIYADSKYGSNTKFIYNSQQFSRLNRTKLIENTSGSLNYNFVLGGAISYNNSSANNTVHLPAGTKLTTGSLISYLNNDDLNMPQKIGSSNYIEINEYIYGNNITKYYIINDITLNKSVNIPYFNTSNMYQRDFMFPALIANVNSTFVPDTQLYNVDSYNKLNTTSIVSLNYDLSMSSFNNLATYKNYSMYIRNNDNKFTCINDTISGFINNVNININENVNGVITLSKNMYTSSGVYPVTRAAKNPTITIKSNNDSNIYLKNYYIILHVDSNDSISSISEGTIINEHPTLNKSDSKDYIFIVLPDTVVYDNVYNNCNIVLNGNLYFVEFVPIIPNISTSYYDNEPYVEISSTSKLLDDYEIDQASNQIYVVYNSMLLAGSKIAKNSVVNGIKYDYDYIIPNDDVEITVPSKLIEGSKMLKGSFIAARSIINGNSVSSDITLSDDVSITSKTELKSRSILKIGSIIAQNSIFNGRTLDVDYEITGELIIKEPSTLAIGTIISKCSTLTSSNSFNYKDRSDKTIEDNSGLMLYNKSIIDKGSYLKPGSIINNDILKYIIPDNISINNLETKIAKGSTLKKGSAIAYGSTLNGKVNTAKAIVQVIDREINTDNKNIILSGSTLKEGSKIYKGSVINGKTFNRDVATIIVADGNSVELINDLTLSNGDVISAGSTIYDIPNEIPENYYERTVNTYNSEYFVDSVIYFNAGSCIKPGSKLITEIENPTAIHINNQTSLTKDITIGSGSKIYTGSKINNNTYGQILTQINNDYNISDSVYVCQNNEMLKSGSKIKYGSIINGKTIEGVITEDNKTLNNDTIYNSGTKIKAGSYISGSDYFDAVAYFNAANSNNGISMDKQYYVRFLKDVRIITDIVKPENIKFENSASYIDFDVPSYCSVWNCASFSIDSVYYYSADNNSYSENIVTENNKLVNIVNSSGHVKIGINTLFKAGCVLLKDIFDKLNECFKQPLGLLSWNELNDVKNDIELNSSISLAPGSVIAAGSAVSSWENINIDGVAYSTITDDITVQNYAYMYYGGFLLKKGSKISVGSYNSNIDKIYVDYILTQDWILDKDTTIYKNSIISSETGSGSSSGDDYLILNKDTTISSTTEILQGSIISTNSKLYRDGYVTLENNITITNDNSYVTPNSEIKYVTNIEYVENEKILSETTKYLKGSIIAAGSYNTTNIYKIKKNYAISDNDIIIKAGSILNEGSKYKGSTVDYILLTSDTEITSDSTLTNGSNILKGSSIMPGSYINGIRVNAEQDILTNDVDIIDETILLEGSVIIKGSIFVDDTIINGDMIDLIYISDDIIIEEYLSTISKGSIISKGSTISKGSVLNNYKYEDDEELSEDLKIDSANNTLTKGCKLASGSVISKSSKLNGITYINNQTISDGNDILIHNASIVLEGSKLITGSTVAESDENIYVIGNVLKSETTDLKEISTRTHFENDSVLCSIYNLYTENSENAENDERSKDYTEYIIVKQRLPLYKLKTIPAGDVIIVEKNSNISDASFDVIKVFNNDNIEPDSTDVNSIIIESNEFYSNSFNLKKAEPNLSHLTFVGQKIINPSNIIVNPGSNIVFNSRNVKLLFIIPPEFTHIVLPLNNGWYRNCLTKCLTFGSKLIYGINDDKNDLGKLEPVDYVFNLFNINSTVYIITESEFNQNLINECVENKNISDNITKVNNQRLNLYVQSEKYKKLLQEINIYEPINEITNINAFNRINEYEIIKRLNTLFVNSNNYYDSTFGLIIYKSSDNYIYSPKCLMDLDTKNIAFAATITDNDDTHHNIMFENNSFMVEPQSNVDNITILPGTGLKNLYINKNNISLHMKDYIHMAVDGDWIDSNGVTVRLGDNISLKALIIDEPTKLNRGESKTIFIDAEKFVLESTLDIGNLSNYLNMNRDLHINYRLLNMTVEMYQDISSGRLKFVNGKLLLNGVEVTSMEQLSHHKTPLIFNSYNDMKRYLTQDMIQVMIAFVPIIHANLVSVLSYCNIYVYYDLNSWNSSILIYERKNIVG